MSCIIYNNNIFKLVRIYFKIARTFSIYRRKSRTHFHLWSCTATCLNQWNMISSFKQKPKVLLDNQSFVWQPLVSGGNKINKNRTELHFVKNDLWHLELAIRQFVIRQPWGDVGACKLKVWTCRDISKHRLLRSHAFCQKDSGTGVQYIPFFHLYSSLPFILLFTYVLQFTFQFISLSLFLAVAIKGLLSHLIDKYVLQQIRTKFKCY